jgi:phage terminase large subunit-like protein
MERQADVLVALGTYS